MAVDYRPYENSLGERKLSECSIESKKENAYILKLIILYIKLFQHKYYYKQLSDFCEWQQI